MQTPAYEIIALEQQIDNVLQTLDKAVHGPAHPGRMFIVRSTVEQLCKLWNEYKAGGLPPLEGDDLSF
jgi:hypothetical protein